MQGLSTQEVEKRVREGKVNGSEERMTSSYPDIIKRNTLTYFNFINFVLFVIVLLTGHIQNGLFFLTIIANTFIGIYQEIKAKKLLEKMALMVASKVKVIRDNEEKEILASEIVLDDTLILEAGMQVPTDGSIIEGYLEIDESLLTGEADVVTKSKGEEVFAGTVITSAKAYVKVEKVGKDCYSAQIMEEARKYKRAKSILHEELEKLIKIVSFAIIPIGITLFLMQHYSIGLNWQDASLKTVAAVIGMIPEGLVVLTSIALATSTIRLARKDVLVQDLFSIESLARVNVLCLDKTGTLTEGSMQVVETIPLLDYKSDYINSVLSSYLYNDEKPNATSKALMRFFGTESIYKKKDVLPFSSDRKYAAAELDGQGSFYLGAPNFLFPLGCPSANKYINKYTAQGMRVLIIAKSEEALMKDELPEDLEPIAMVVLSDILRSNVVEILDYFKKQDVALKVISGDDPLTVSSLAVQAGIDGAEYYVDMSKTNDSYEDLVRHYNVFGRVRPDQKKELVVALQKLGNTVAMTGDGVNDVPALKTADVSVAMGEGASATKDSSNIILLANDFAEMPKIVDEGRRVINNISRASSMYLVKTIFSVLLSIYVVLLRQEYPFLPVHLSLISALGVGLPTFLLQMEPSFERVKGNFFKKAFMSSFPTAITVFLTALLCLALRHILKLPLHRYYGIFVALTGFMYFYTLFRVYYPPTTLRKIVLISMSLIFISILFFIPEIFELSYTIHDAIIIAIGIVILPFVISSIAKLTLIINRKIQRA